MEFVCLELYEPYLYRKSSIKFPREGGGGRGNINEDWGLILEGVLFNLETTMVSVRRKELEAQVQEVLGHAAEGQNQIRTSS